MSQILKMYAENGVLIHRVSENNKGNRGTIMFLTIIAAIGGFLFGYDTGVISGSMILLKEQFGLDSTWQELIVSITVCFAAIFAFIGSPANNIFGRKGVILISSATFTAGSLILAFARDKYMLLGGRAVVGGAIGLSSMTIPMYIAESSPPEIRGKLVTVNCMFITGGQVVASCIDGAFSGDKINGWRYMLGLAALPAMLQFLGFMFLPESPRWLIHKGRTKRAINSLRKLLGDNDNKIQAEVETLQETFDDQSSGGFCRILSDPRVRKALVVGCGIQMFQQLAGINTVMYYSATILQMSGVKNDQVAIWLAAAVASVNFLGSIIGLWLVEKLGRRSLALLSMVGVTLSLLFLSLSFFLPAIHSPPVTMNSTAISQDKFGCYKFTLCEPCMLSEQCGFCYMKFENMSGVTESTCLPADPDHWHSSLVGRCANDTGTSKAGPFFAKNYCPTDYSWMALVGMVIYLLCFAPGLGTVPWTINSEIYPQWARSTGNALSTGTNWIFNMLISLTFLHLSQQLTYQGAFLLYAGFAFAGLIFIFLLLPETKGKQLEEIENLFNSGWIVRKSRSVDSYRVILNSDNSENEDDTLFVR